MSYYLNEKKKLSVEELVVVAYQKGKKHGYQKGYRAGKKYIDKAITISLPSFEEACSVVRKTRLWDHRETTGELSYD
jgi:flagellar biosynthesis/type III secretory pathway protein FliH